MLFWAAGQAGQRFWRAGHSFLLLVEFGAGPVETFGPFALRGRETRAEPDPRRAEESGEPCRAETRTLQTGRIVGSSCGGDWCTPPCSASIGNRSFVLIKSVTQRSVHS